MRQIITVLFLLCAMTSKAQFFFGFPPQQRMERSTEKYTAPSYKKGEAGMKAYIQKNFKNATEREKVDGKIVVAVIVNPKGNPAEVQVVRSLRAPLDAEAVRVCKKMKFTPATLGKKKVKGRIDITFPIRNGRLSYIDLPTVDV